MDVSNESLARAAATGDRAAFSSLAERHYDRVFRLAWRLTGVRAEAEDLTQDIFAALPSKLANWRGDARLETWLYRVVMNAAQDRRRRQAVQVRAATGWGDWEITRQDDIRAERDGRDWLMQAMQALPQELRDTVALVLGEDLSQAEAGAVLGLSEGTIAWRMSEVRKRLRVQAQTEARA